MDDSVSKDASSDQHFCDVCNLEYLTKNDLVEHTWSLLHHKRLDKQKGRDYSHKCTLCDVDTSGLLLFTKHIHGDEHQKKLQEWKTEHAQETPVEAITEENESRLWEDDGRDFRRWIIHEYERPRGHKFYRPKDFGPRNFPPHQFVPRYQPVPRFTSQPQGVNRHRNNSLKYRFHDLTPKQRSSFVQNENRLGNPTTHNGSPAAQYGNPFRNYKYQKSKKNTLPSYRSQSNFNVHTEPRGNVQTAVLETNFKGFEATRKMREKFKKIGKVMRKSDQYGTQWVISPNNAASAEVSWSDLENSNHRYSRDMVVECQDSFKVLSRDSESIDPKVPGKSSNEESDAKSERKAQVEETNPTETKKDSKEKSETKGEKKREEIGPREGKRDSKEKDGGRGEKNEQIKEVDERNKNNECPFVGSKEEEVLASFVAENLWKGTEKDNSYEDIESNGTVGSKEGVIIGSGKSSNTNVSRAVGPGGTEDERSLHSKQNTFTISSKSPLNSPLQDLQVFSQAFRSENVAVGDALDKVPYRHFSAAIVPTADPNKSRTGKSQTLPSSNALQLSKDVGRRTFENRSVQDRPHNGGSLITRDNATIGNQVKDVVCTVTNSFVSHATSVSRGSIIRSKNSSPMSSEGNRYAGSDGSRYIHNGIDGQRTRTSDEMKKHSNASSKINMSNDRTNSESSSFVVTAVSSQNSADVHSTYGVKASQAKPSSSTTAVGQKNCPATKMGSSRPNFSTPKNVNVSRIKTTNPQRLANQSLSGTESSGNIVGETLRTEEQPSKSYQNSLNKGTPLTLSRVSTVFRESEMHRDLATDIESVDRDPNCSVNSADHASTGSANASLETSILSLDESLKSSNLSNQCEFRYKDGRRCPTPAEQKFCSYHEKVVRDVFNYYARTKSHQISQPESDQQQPRSDETTLASTQVPSCSVISTNLATVSEPSSGILQASGGNRSIVSSSDGVAVTVSDSEDDSDHMSLQSRFKYLHKAGKNPLSGLGLSRTNLPRNIRKLLHKHYGNDKKTTGDSEATARSSQYSQVTAHSNVGNIISNTAVQEQSSFCVTSVVATSTTAQGAIAGVPSTSILTSAHSVTRLAIIFSRDGATLQSSTNPVRSDINTETSNEGRTSVVHDQNASNTNSSLPVTTLAASFERIPSTVSYTKSFAASSASHQSNLTTVSAASHQSNLTTVSAASHQSNLTTVSAASHQSNLTTVSAASHQSNLTTVSAASHQSNLTTVSAASHQSNLTTVSASISSSSVSNVIASSCCTVEVTLDSSMHTIYTFPSNKPQSVSHRPSTYTVNASVSGLKDGACHNKAGMQHFDANGSRGGNSYRLSTSVAAIPTQSSASLKKQVEHSSVPVMITRPERSTAISSRSVPSSINQSSQLQVHSSVLSSASTNQSSTANGMFYLFVPNVSTVGTEISQGNDYCKLAKSTHSGRVQSKEPTVGECVSAIGRAQHSKPQLNGTHMKTTSTEQIPIRESAQCVSSIEHVTSLTESVQPKINQSHSRSTLEINSRKRTLLQTCFERLRKSQENGKEKELAYSWKERGLQRPPIASVATSEGSPTTLSKSRQSRHVAEGSAISLSESRTVAGSSGATLSESRTIVEDSAAALSESRNVSGSSETVLSESRSVVESSVATSSESRNVAENHTTGSHGIMEKSRFASGDTTLEQQTPPVKRKIEETGSLKVKKPRIEKDHNEEVKRYKDLQMKEDIISNTLKSMVERIGDAENQLILLQKSLRNWQKQKRRLRRSLCKIWEEKERIMKGLGNGSKSVTESNMKTGSSIGNRECTNKKECLTEKGGNEGVEHGKRFAQNTENESTLLRKHVHHDAQKKKWKTTNTKNRTVMNSESGNIRDDNMNFVNNCSSTVANVNMGVLQSVQSSSNSLVNNTSLQSSTLSDFSKGTQSDGSVDSRLSALDMRSSKNLLCVSDVGEINSDSMTGSTDLFEFQSDDEKCASSMKAKHRTKPTKLKLPSAQGRGTYSKQGNIILASDCRRSPRVQLTDIASIMLGKGINVYTPYESPIVLLKKQMGETEAESAGKSRQASTFMGQEGFTAHGDVSSNMGASTTMAQEKVIADGEVSSNMGASTTLHQEKVIADGDASSNMGASTTMGQEKVIADENVSSNMEVSKTMNQDKVIADRTVSSNMGASTTLHQEKVIADGEVSSNMGASTTMGQEKVIANGDASSNMGASTTLHQEKVVAYGDMSSNMGASTALRQEKVIADGDMSSNMGTSTTLHQKKVIAGENVSSNMGASTTLCQEKVIADGEVSSNMGASTTLRQEKVIAGENVSSNMGASTTLRQEKVIADGEVSSNMGASTTLRQEKVIADGEVSSNKGASTTLRQEKVIADGEVSSNMGASTTMGQEKVIADGDVSSNVVRVSVKTSVEQPSRFGVNAKADTNKVAGKSIMVKDKASFANGQRREILNDTTCRESSARKTTEGGLEISPDLLLFKIISTMTPNGNTCNDVAVNKFVSSNSSMVTERGLIRKEMVGERGQQKCLEGPETSNRLASDPLKAKYVDKVGMTERRGHQKCLEGQEKSINLAREPLKARLVAKRRQFERGIDSHCSAEEPICNEVENEIQGVNSPKKSVITEQASCVKEVSARNEAKLNKEMLSRKQTASLTETTSIGTDRLGGPEVRRKDTAPNNKRKCNEGVDSSTSNIAPSNEKRPHVASKDDVIVRTESSSSTENPFWKEASSRLKAFINESLKKKAVKSESNQNIGGNNHPVTTQSLSRQQTSWISGLQESLELFSRATKKTDVELKPILPHSYHRPSVQVADVYKPHIAAISGFQHYHGLLYSSSDDGTIKVHKIKNRKLSLKATVTCESPVNCVEIHCRDTKPMLIAGCGTEVIFYDLCTLERRRKQSVQAEVEALHVGFMNLYVGLRDGFIYITSLKNMCLIGHASYAEVTKNCSKIQGTRTVKCIKSTVVCDRNGVLKRILVVLFKDAICFLDAMDLSCIRTLAMQCSCLAVHKKKFYLGCKGELYCGDLEELTPPKTFCKQREEVTSLIVVGDLLVTSSRDRLIRCFSILTGRILQVYGEQSGNISAIGSVPGDQMTIYSGNECGGIRQFVVDLDDSIVCEWQNCQLPFGITGDLKMHVLNHHVKKLTNDRRCNWKSCTHFYSATLSQKGFEDDMTHIDNHLGIIES